jgi:UDP-N-acetylmuramoyl-tripeptide--D-alanyl-D-alanine ligase
MVGFVAEKINQGDYLVQPYINCRTKSGNAYDFRLHVQKDVKGEWVIARIYPRIAKRGGIVCNISSGGGTADLAVFLKKEFKGAHFDIRKYIEEFSLQLAAHMDKIQKELYSETLDELGIDIGLDKNRKICIYEVNWRPGQPPAVNLDLSVVKNAVGYAMFLASKTNKRNGLNK